MSDIPDREVVILNAALEMPVEQRAAYLDKACADDTTLRRRVKELIQSHEQAENFLEAPPAGLDFAIHPVINLPAEKPGDRIGRYKLLQQIGEGGCGVVYMAEQEEPVRRRVALKIIKLGMDTKSVIARFEAERQALALMEHPNIAKVLDAGATEKGRPYFVMELVRGIKITDYCDRNNLSTRQRLGLMVQVCRAIQHAHQKGIIHRDIKPSNILVTVNDGVAVLKVIDFGIAKATQGRLTDKTLFTAFEQFIGTPAYMSPEQAVMTSLDIDTRSDIYSLGVLLYELLTGKTPFDSKELMAGGVDEMRRTIREKEPERPSARLNTMGAAALTTTAAQRQTEAPKLIHLVRGDLDWIVMKCLEKDRTRRYETANGLAADVQRYLDNEPVTARPPSRLYRFQKAVRRNRVAFTAGAAIAIVLVLGLVTSTWQAIRARRAERGEIRLRQRAEAGEKRANTEAARSEQVARFLKDMLYGVGPSVAQGRDTALLRDILDKTAARVADELPAQPEVQGDLYFTLGQTYSDLTDEAKAEEMFTRALEKYRAVLTPPHAKLALTLGELAVAKVSQGKANAGQLPAEESLRLARDLGDQKILVTVLRDRARALDPDQDIPEAIPFLREALAIQKQLGDNPVAEADILRQLGGCLAWGTNLPNAEICLREALELHRRHLATNDMAVAQDYFNLAQVLEQQRKFTEAEASIRKAIDIVRPVVDPDHLTMTSYTAFLSHILIELGKWDEAETLLKESVARAPESAAYRNALGNYYARRGRWMEAAQELKQEAALCKDPAYAPLFPIVALLEAGQVNDCLKLWRTYAERHANTREFIIADKMAKAGLLLPLDETDLARGGASG